MPKSSRRVETLECDYFMRSSLDIYEGSNLSAAGMVGKKYKQLLSGIYVYHTYDKGDWTDSKRVTQQ
jgi:hypothetical protein